MHLNQVIMTLITSDIYYLLFSFSASVFMAFLWHILSKIHEHESFVPENYIILKNK